MAAETGAISNQRHEHQLTREKLRMGFFLTLVLLVVELVGGMAAHALALLIYCDLRPSAQPEHTHRQQPIER